MNMISKWILDPCWFAALLVYCGLVLCPTQRSSAQELDVRVSSQETYVGQPIEMQITIEGTVEINPPTLPEIDGCDVQSVGPPSTSSQIMIINGRRSESFKVVLGYRITPRRAGTFHVPPFTLSVNGKQKRTPEFDFVAETSEAGDLLFVEVEAEQEQVYVGEPLRLTLKIWIKPFVDRERGLTLSEANMWQMISRSTEWGVFGDAIEELVKNDQRPEGREVLRDDGTGKQRAYYLYEIEAMVYPKRAELIGVEDVQIVWDYPTKLDRVRGTFDSVFGGSLFGDDLFNSPLRNRLAVSKYRPIAVDAKIDAVQVIPVPTAGRPADYRGAVGKYQIITSASPTHVSAGDAIELRIGIVGNGPMELVQAPPLNELEALTADFKVEAASLAGFVQDDAKVFPTTIRPRREGITSIPPIPMSFFDPETKSFHTVYSEPIPITVDKAESLALDAIVSNAQQRSGTTDNVSASGSKSFVPNLANSDEVEILNSQSRDVSANGWLLFVVVPPCIWLVITLLQYRHSIATMLAAIARTRHSPEQRCLQTIERTNQSAELKQALVQYVAQRSGERLTSAPTLLDNSAGLMWTAGQLRILGAYALAADVERWWDSTANLEDQKRSLRELLDRLSATFRNQPSRSKIGSAAGRYSPAAHGGIQANDLAGKTLALIFLIGLSTAAGNALANDTQVVDATASKLTATEATRSQPIFTEAQQRELLSEASELYRRGRESAEQNDVSAAEFFARAADKYQMLIDSGISNGRLLMNAGNAYLLSDQLGRAIASYERALQVDPGQLGLRENLQFARSLVKEQPEVNSSEPRFSLANSLLVIHHSVMTNVGLGRLQLVIAAASMLFWGMLIVAQVGSLRTIRRLSLVPLLILLLAAGIYLVPSDRSMQAQRGILLADQVVLRGGDDANFDEVATISNADGQTVRVLRSRAGWTQVETPAGSTGWLSDTQIATGF